MTSGEILYLLTTRLLTSEDDPSRMLTVINIRGILSLLIDNCLTIGTSLSLRRREDQRRGDGIQRDLAGVHKGDADDRAKWKM